MIKQMSLSSINNSVDYRNMSGSIIPSSEYLISSFIITGSSTPSVEFTNIPQHYKHLMLVAIMKSERPTVVETQQYLQLNGSTAADFSFHRMFNSGSTVTSTAATSANASIGWASVQATASGIYGVSVVDILDYTSSTKNKTVRAFGGWLGGNSYVHLTSFSGASTSPITSIKISDLNGSFNLSVGSRYSLYGVTA